MKVTFTRLWGFRLLAVVLILWGASLALERSFPNFNNFNIVLGILAIVAGVLILIER